MKKYITFFIFSFLLLQGIKAQTNFRDGYILVSESDTLFGKIDNKDYFQNSEYCDFRQVNSNSVVRYYPGRIYGYRFMDGKYYVSEKIILGQKQTELFMEYLIKGRLNIFYYQDRNFVPHYYASKDSVSLQELKYDEGVKEAGGVQVFYQEKQYTGILNYLTSDCPAIKADISKLNEPGQENLITIAKKYHNLTCTSEKCIIYDKKIPRKLLLGICAGSQAYFSNDLFSPDSSTKGKMYPVYSFNVLVQQAQRLENFYLGIGFSCVPGVDDGKNFYRIPLSLNYLNPRPGLSPFFSMEFDINRMFAQAFIAGVKFQTPEVALSLSAGMNTLLIYRPYGYSLNFGLLFALR
ncbi:MAG: hypothetical protein WCR72_12605 [Bacteroidota bacterium]